jgi:monofunctional biosynthetic peptidoglycan transglycosylase
MRAYPSYRFGRPPAAGKNRKGRNKNGFWPRLARAILVAVVAVVLLSVLLVLPFRWIDPPTTAFMLQDKSGRMPVLYEWVAWDELGQAMPLSVVASEDQTFAQHLGFDVKSIRASVADFGGGEPLRGASTISQQVAKNLYLWRGRSFLRKGIEAYLTVLIEVAWSKKRILEIYVNIAELGPGVYGVGAASEVYFRKSPRSLSDAEAALLAAVLPNPIRLQVDHPTQYVRQRQAWILRQMQRLRREQWLTLLD